MANPKNPSQGRTTGGRFASTEETKRRAAIEREREMLPLKYTIRGMMASLMRGTASADRKQEREDAALLRADN